MNIDFESRFFPSSDGKSEIGYNLWTAGFPKAILQIAHGMSEHIDRYDDFARYMAGQGYAVAGNNHIGHGNSVKTSGDLGHIEGSDGYRRIAEDMKTLSSVLRERFPGVPLILLGHSMGSLFARYYAAEWPNEADALILSGTSGSNPLNGVGLMLVDFLIKMKGARYRSGFIDHIAFGSYNRRWPETATAFGWLSADEDNVARYIGDERCGMRFTLSGFRNLFAVLKEVSEKDWAAKIRKDLPVLMISGKDDPTGDYGKGVAEVANRLRSAGVKNLTLLLYDGMRHEVLNETGKERVYADVLRFCGEIVKK